MALVVVGWLWSHSESESENPDSVRAGVAEGEAGGNKGRKVVTPDVEGTGDGVAEGEGSTDEAREDGVRGKKKESIFFCDSDWYWLAMTCVRKERIAV